MENDTNIVFLAISQKGFETALLMSIKSEIIIWCGSDAITEVEFKSYSNQNITRFDYSLSDNKTLEGAINTIKEHHPESVIWVENDFY